MLSGFDASLCRAMPTSRRGFRRFLTGADAKIWLQIVRFGLILLPNEHIFRPSVTVKSTAFSCALLFLCGGGEAKQGGVRESARLMRT